MALDAREVDAAIVIDPAWAEEMRALWMQVMRLAVFGDLRTGRIGALGRFRRKVLDSGEKLRALLAARDWIPQPRERLKSSLACFIGCNESLALVEADAATLEGTDGESLRVALAELRATANLLTERANAWAALLDRPGEEGENADDDSLSPR